MSDDANGAEPSLLLRTTVPPPAAPAPRPPADDQPVQRDLYRREVEAIERGSRHQGRATTVQAIATVFALIATAIAAWAAFAATSTVQETRRGVDAQIAAADRQTRDERLSTAIEAFSADSPASRIGGATLLVRDVEDRLQQIDSLEAELEARPDDAQRRDRFFGATRDAVAVFGGTLDILENYLRDPQRTSVLPEGRVLPDRGFGRPVVPAEVSYVQSRLVTLLGHGDEIEERQDQLREAGQPVAPASVDLAAAMLYGAQLPGVDLSWLGGRYFAGIDLRSANLTGSDWSGSTLNRAYLQCADLGPRNKRPARLAGTRLVEADLRGANLTGADLTGVDLTRADLRGANLADADLAGAKIDGARFEGSFGNLRGQPSITFSTRTEPHKPEVCRTRADLDAVPVPPGPQPPVPPVRAPLTPEDAIPRAAG